MFGKRVLVVTGHFGGGKTEFSVNLALRLKRENPSSRVALVDLDIANPYFRARERATLLAEHGVSLYGSAYEGEITAELPSLAASIRAPLEDTGCRVVVDVGGNETGARVLHQFRKYLERGEHALLAVVNANRPETADLPGAIAHLRAIEAETGFPVDGLVSNCHLLWETDAAQVRRGHALCEAVAERTGIPILIDCYPAPLVDPGALPELLDTLFPLDMLMREKWM